MNITSSLRNVTIVDPLGHLLQRGYDGYVHTRREPDCNSLHQRRVGQGFPAHVHAAVAVLRPGAVRGHGRGRDAGRLARAGRAVDPVRYLRPVGADDNLRPRRHLRFQRLVAPVPDPYRGLNAADRFSGRGRVPLRVHVSRKARRSAEDS